MSAPLCFNCVVSTKEVEGRSGVYECPDCENEFDSFGRLIPLLLPSQQHKPFLKKKRKHTRHARIDGPYFPA